MLLNCLWTPREIWSWPAEALVALSEEEFACCLLPELSCFGILSPEIWQQFTKVGQLPLCLIDRGALFMWDCMGFMGFHTCTAQLSCVQRVLFCNRSTVIPGHDLALPHSNPNGWWCPTTTAIPGGGLAPQQSKEVVAENTGLGACQCKEL